MDNTRVGARDCDGTAAAAGLFLLSASTLVFEIHLMRLFSVAQFYHFAFMIISLAMLGFGASGTILSLSPRFGRTRPAATLAGLALAHGAAAVGAFLFTNVRPFDSFSIALDWRQSVTLILHYFALSTPFFFGGCVLALLFTLMPAKSDALYSANLVGSAVGCAVGLVSPAQFGGVGTVFLCGAFGGAAAYFLSKTVPAKPARFLGAICPALALCSIAAAVVLPQYIELRISPYKGLNYALQYPGARVVFSRWNAFSRVDVVESEGIRSLRGLSYRFVGPLPPQNGVFVDADDLTPALTTPGPTNGPDSDSLFDFTDYLPAAVVHQLRPNGQSLVLEPRGGISIWTALAQGASHVTAVEPNSLIVEAVGGVYQHPRVTPRVEDPRSFLNRTSESYDIIEVALTSGYRPVRSGAYSLSENYAYTVEAFTTYLEALTPNGLLLVTRWAQLPPSEGLRAFNLALSSLERMGFEPETRIAAFRSFSTIAIVMSRLPFAEQDLEVIRRFTEERAFDLVYLPGMSETEANRFSVLEEPLYFRAFASALRQSDGIPFVDQYPYDVTSPTDNRPYFGAYFKWSQVNSVIADLGRVWQPFGGAGILVLVAVLGIAVVAAGTLIVMPLAAARHAPRERRVEGAPKGNVSRGSVLSPLTYFALLGLGYLFVEIPLVQKYVLFLGNPAYALAIVLFSLLAFSGVGSILSERIPHGAVMALLPAVALAYPFILGPLFKAAIGLQFATRVFVAVASLAPLGTLMGVPFPTGIAWLQAHEPHRVPWAWGVNGATSVVGSVLAALLSITAGFKCVLTLGALCYAVAWLTMRHGMGSGSGSAAPPPVSGTNTTSPKL